MLEVSNTAYDSVMYFDTKEYKEIAPWGQMPLLRMPQNFGEDYYLPQSSTIVRHIAHMTGLDAGLQDFVTKAKIDSVYAG